MPKNNLSPQPAAIEYRLAQLTAVAFIVPSLGLVFVLWLFEVSWYTIGLFAVLLSGLGLYCTISVWQKTQFQFRNLHNLLDAIGHGDYSLRGATHNSSNAYSNLIESINTLADTLHRQRLQSEEGQYLLEKIVNQFDGAVVAWDNNDCIKIINRAAAKLLDIPYTADQSTPDRKVSLPKQLATAKSMSVGATRVVDNPFGSAQGKYRWHLEQFIADGETHNLLFMTNVSDILREEEKKAWKNLIRVLSHEINNSLAPLSSLSNTLQKQVQKREQDPELADELQSGLAIVENRAKSLQSFIQHYRDVATLPAPEKTTIEFKALVEGLVKLFPELNIEIGGESIELLGDSAQLEQAFINLIKNAADANRANTQIENSEKKIEIYWYQQDANLIIKIKDVGLGIQNTENLFTPFYSTKEHGSGVGLVLCQQVIEGHGGYLTIGNREDQSGCVVRVELPVSLNE